MLVQIQKNIQRLDGGGSSFAFALTSEIVLKAPVTCQLPEDASSQDRYEFALTTFFYHDDIRNEREILSMLETALHPNIIQPIAFKYPEGLYLQRYQSLSSILTQELPPPLIRKCFYRDMLSALTHLHGLKIAHADVRIDNLLWKEGGRVAISPAPDLSEARIHHELFLQRH